MMRGASVHGTPRPGSGPLVGRRWHLSAGPCSEWELPRGSGTCGSLVGNKLKNSLSLAGGSRALSPHLPTCLLWGQGMAPEHPGSSWRKAAPDCSAVPQGPFPRVCSASTQASQCPGFCGWSPQTRGSPGIRIQGWLPSCGPLGRLPSAAQLRRVEHPEVYK